MDNIFQQKKGIRHRIEKQRRELPSDWVDSKSSIIISKLRDLPEYQSAKIVHCYVAWHNEVNTYNLIKTSLNEGKRIIVPVTDLANHNLKHAEIKIFDELRPGTFGILEPSPDSLRIVDLSEIDLIIVPGVAFDRCGNRLGFGGGYYDGFLAKTKTTKIALAYMFQIVEKLPVRAEDEQVDILVSEKDVYSFKRL